MRRSLNLVLLLLLVNFVRGFRLELRYIYFTENIRSTLTHLRGFQLLVLLPQFIEITFFRLHQKAKSADCTVMPGRLVIIAKGFLKLPKLHMLIKQESITSQKLGSQDFGQIANSVLNKGKSAITPLFKGPEMLSSASDKAKLFLESFSLL